MGIYAPPIHAAFMREEALRCVARLAAVPGAAVELWLRYDAHPQRGDMWAMLLAALGGGNGGDMLMNVDVCATVEEMVWRLRALEALQAGLLLRTFYVLSTYCVLAVGTRYVYLLCVLTMYRPGCCAPRPPLTQVAGRACSGPPRTRRGYTHSQHTH
tara:strand:- start:301 stop:771 length:471 start_codon:yes stop_codon:yes gene_type:complete